MSFPIKLRGGTLFLMMGQQTCSESLFYYFRMEDHIPEDHLLRLVDRHIDFAFVREALNANYSHTSRPSIDTEVLLPILLIGYLYGITSERRLVEDVGMHVAYCWFTGLGFDQEVPRITRHFPKIGTAAFSSRRSFWNCLSASSNSASMSSC